VFSNDLLLAGLLLLAAISIATIVFLLVNPYFSGERRTDKRIQGVTENRTQRVAIKAQADAAQNRRRQVTETLKDLEDREKQREKVSMRLRLERAGLEISPRAFWMASLGCGLGVGLSIWLSAPNLPIIVPLLGIFVGALGLPRWVLARLIKRRQYKFTDEFANAIDVIVRGVKAGLPLNDCIRVIAAETREPVKSEFRAIVESTSIGMPLTEAATKLYDRIPLPESNFFGIVIMIQQKAGGSLAEALSNLSRVLRERKKMKSKIQAMSMEAKASAAIIASLPIAVMLLVYLTSPSYIELLWTEPMGRLMLFCSAVWMMVGTLVMRRMINFDF
jgi:tight adherence protein B